MELPDGWPLHVVNLHLRAPLASPVPGQRESGANWRSAGGWAEGFFLSTVRRAGQALEARLLVERLFDADPQALIAVVGDCNAEAAEVPVRILCGDLADTRNGHLAARALVRLENSLPEDRRWSVLYGGQRLLFDRILVSRSLFGSFRSMEIHNETVIDELAATAAGMDVADSFHAPVVATFALGSD